MAMGAAMDGCLLRNRPSATASGSDFFADAESRERERSDSVAWPPWLSWCVPVECGVYGMRLERGLMQWSLRANQTRHCLRKSFLQQSVSAPASADVYMRTAWGTLVTPRSCKAYQPHTHSPSVTELLEPRLPPWFSGFDDPIPMMRLMIDPCAWNKV